MTWGQIAACSAALAELDPDKKPAPDFDPTKSDGGVEYQDRMAALLLANSKKGKLNWASLAPGRR